MCALAPARSAVCRGRLHHRRVLVHRLNVVCESRGHGWRDLLATPSRESDLRMLLILFWRRLPERLPRQFCFDGWFRACLRWRRMWLQERQSECGEGPNCWALRFVPCADQFAVVELKLACRASHDYLG